LRVGGSELLLNGAGLRSKLFIKVYVGALYVHAEVGEPGGDHRQHATAPHRHAPVARSRCRYAGLGALDDGLQATTTARPNWPTLKPQIDQLAGIMKGIGKAREAAIRLP
jgi:hypothetical protein